MVNRRTYPVRFKDLDRLRESKGMSIEKLAAKAGISVRTIKRIQNGEEALLSSIAQIAKALGLPTCDRLRADIPLETEKPTSQFTLGLTITGGIDSIQQLQELLYLSPSIKSTLESAGIKLSSFDAKLSVEEQTGETLKRIITIIYGQMNTGTPFWVFAAIRPSRYDIFQAKYLSGELDVRTFDLYGEVLVCGEGTEPPLSITDKIAEMYQTDSKTLMQSMINEPPPTKQS